jgi:endonuclease YncB( thermonuclease family)
VIDCDTIVFMDASRVRLEGIDALERDQPDGPTATAALEYMVGRSVYYVEADKDRYERLLAALYHSKEGYNITASLVRTGHAWCY